MKRYCIIITLMVFLYLNVNAQNASIGDFQLPETKVERLFVALDMNASGVDTLNFYGVGNLQYYNIFNSLSYSYRYGMEMKYDKSLQGLNLVYPFYARISGDLQKYINNESLFFYGGQFNSGLYVSEGNMFDLRDYNYVNTIRVGGGYGRIVPASGMAEALRIQEYLLEEKLITGEFSKETLIELASHCARLYEYSEKYGDRHPIEWYTDLEKILIATGKLDNNRFSPYALLRVEEILGRERIYERMIGWRLSGYINYENTYYGGYFVNPIIRFRNEIGTSLQLSLGVC